MHRYGIIGVWLFAIAVWAQLLAPVAAERMDRAFDPTSVICAHTSDKDGSGGPGHASHDHHCCTLCHAYLGGAALDTRPLYTRLDLPVASVLRWHVVADAPVPRAVRRAHRPRDPPALV